MKFEKIIGEASQILGLQLPSINEGGAIQMVDQDDRAWLIDCPAGSQQVKLSCVLPNAVASNANFERSLAMNADRSRMGMAWLALDKSKFILGASVPLTLLTGRQFSNLLENMHSIVGHIEFELLR